MNYDQYKLATDKDNNSDLVTSCCGNEEESSLIQDEIISICVECCQPYPDMIELYEYDEKMKEHYSELDNEDY